MKRRIFFGFIVTIIFIIIIILFFDKFLLHDEVLKKQKNIDDTYKSNFIENVEYKAKDIKGNEYIIRAKNGEIDLNNSNVIFLERIIAEINLKNSSNINITSDYGKYNTLNYDTIFSKNVLIKYTDNIIESDYLDFSIKRNNMTISKNVIYSNPENIVYADVIEIKIDNKDTKIFMYEDTKKVNLKTKKFNGNN